MTGGGGSRAARRAGEGFVAKNEEMAAELFRTRDFRFRLAFTGNADGAFCTAARGEIRQGIERGDGIAEMIQQVAEGDGADIFAAGEAEAGKTLRGGERRCHAGQSPVLSSAFFWPMRDSSPARRRRMLSRCAM